MKRDCKVIKGLVSLEQNTLKKFSYFPSVSFLLCYGDDNLARVQNGSHVQCQCIKCAKCPRALEIAQNDSKTHSFNMRKFHNNNVPSKIPDSEIPTYWKIGSQSFYPQTIFGQFAFRIFLLDICIKKISNIGYFICWTFHLGHFT